MNQDEMRASIKAERNAMMPKEPMEIIGSLSDVRGPDAEGERRGLLYVSPYLLAEALHIPDGTEILGAEWCFSTKSLVIHVKHPALTLIPEGVPVMRCDVVITQHVRPAVEGDVMKTYESRWA